MPRQHRAADLYTSRLQNELAHHEGDKCRDDAVYCQNSDWLLCRSDWCVGSAVYSEVYCERCSYSTVPQKVDVRLPLSVNKFMEPADMDAAQFFQRWKLLSQLV